VSEPPPTNEPFANWQRSDEPPPQKKVVPESDEERDIAAVAADSAEKYLVCYRRRRAGDFLNVHWPAFFIPTIWLFYRRQWEAAVGWWLGASLYGQGLAYALVTWPGIAELGPLLLIASLLPSITGSLIAYPLFFRRVRHLQAEADQFGLVGEPRLQFLKRRGEGSGWGFLAGAGFTAATIWAAMATH
jgi:hypothetical protein